MALLRERCRSCGAPDLDVFLDLGETPLADALVRPEHIDAEEPRFPLRAAFCGTCALVQITHDVPPEELFVDNYLYFSSYSDVLLAHAEAHVDGLVTSRGLGSEQLVVEIASNDGYLLRHAADRGVRVLGIDPAPDQANAAEAAGIETLREFFSLGLAEQLVAQRGHADVIIANNVMAHVPDLDGFVRGMSTLLAPDGLVTIENPSVVELVERGAFDTIYHEHHCYFSATSVDRLLAPRGLHLNHVESFPDLHGGTLRYHATHLPGRSDALEQHLARERALGADRADYYAAFADVVARVVASLRAVLEDLSAQGATVAGYGAAAKGATLLNRCGVGRDLVDFVVDRNPWKQGRLMPGTHQPVLPVEALVERQPDHVLLLAWNFADEIVAQQQDYLRAGGRFLIPVPEPMFIDADGGRTRARAS